MIAPDARLCIRVLPLECIQVKEYQPRYPERVAHYINLMQCYPEQYPGFVSVTPSDTHSGMYALLDGHHRYVAHILTGRSVILCVVIEDEKVRTM